MRFAVLAANVTIRMISAIIIVASDAGKMRFVRTMSAFVPAAEKFVVVKFVLILPKMRSIVGLVACALMRTAIVQIIADKVA